MCNLQKFLAKDFNLKVAGRKKKVALKAKY